MKEHVTYSEQYCLASYDNTHEHHTENTQNTVHVISKLIWYDDEWGKHT